MVNIGQTELNIGLTYVALSRVKSLQGLALDQGFNFERISTFKNKQIFNERACVEELMQNGDLSAAFNNVNL